MPVVRTECGYLFVEHFDGEVPLWLSARSHPRLPVVPAYFWPPAYVDTQACPLSGKPVTREMFERWYADMEAFDERLITFHMLRGKYTEAVRHRIETSRAERAADRAALMRQLDELDAQNGGAR